MSTGLNGTPMPSFAESMKEDERWAISYFVLSLSAFVDPLTGQPLRLPPAARAALNGDGVTAHHPRLALDPARLDRVAQAPERRRTFDKGIGE